MSITRMSQLCVLVPTTSTDAGEIYNNRNNNGNNKKKKSNTNSKKKKGNDTMDVISDSDDSSDDEDLDEVEKSCDQKRKRYKNARAEAAPKTATSRSQITTKPTTSASLKRSQEVTSNASSVLIDEQVSKITKLFHDKHVECCKLTYDLNQ